MSYLEGEALGFLAATVAEIETLRVPGLLLELGCGLGGSSIVIAASKAETRPLEIYDTFSMIPPPSDRDEIDAHDRYREISAGRSAGIAGNPYYGYERDLLEKVKANFQRCGISQRAESIRFIKGLYSDTLAIHEAVAFAHIDCDWYDSVYIALERITPCLSQHGALVIDDYRHWSGCRRAVDDYFADRRDEFQFDDGVRLRIKRRPVN